TKMAPHEIANLGILQVPEGRRIFGNLTVMENLLMGAYRRKDDISDDLEWVFNLFPRLKERQKQNAGTLSGGEQQMLAISRALMSKPRLMLLDEPSLGLAPLLVFNIFETIKEINRQGVTILLVEQNAYMALQIAHRAYVLETGKVVLEGTGKELLNNEMVRKAYLGG
ncbi:MAG: ABC transporter ATP-binding protein, partial [bacterium]